MSRVVSITKLDFGTKKWEKSPYGEFIYTLSVINHYSTKYKY